MTYPRAVLTAWLLAVLLACALAYDMAHAGQWAIDMKGGLAVPFRTTPDGTYYQEAFHHSTRTFTPAYAVGIAYQATPAWSVSAHWLDLGSSMLRGVAVADSNYDYKASKCIKDCNLAYAYQATDSLKGVDLIATYTWTGASIQPYVQGGVAILRHSATFQNVQNMAIDRFTGIVPELELGAGLRYEWAYVELDWFQGLNFGGQNLPISTQQVAAFAGVQIPIF